MTGMETPTDSQVSGRTRRQGIRTLQEYIAQRSVARHSCGKAIALFYRANIAILPSYVKSLANSNERHKQSVHIFRDSAPNLSGVEKPPKTYKSPRASERSASGSTRRF